MADASLITRLRARLSGEIASDSLDAYRAAGAGAYDLYVATEARRAAQRRDAGALNEASSACAWNAFVLQTLGDAFVDADYRADPKTVGFVPPVTADQALAFYAQVEQWLVRARRTEQEPGRPLDVQLPAELPGWAQVEPCPEPHLHAMLSACRSIVEHAELAVADLAERSDVPAERARSIRAELAAADTSRDYAEQLHARFHAGSGSRELHERIERSIKDAVERAYLTGQLAAWPALTEQQPTAPAPAGRLPGPGEPGFDPWCLTDPETRGRWQRDRLARRAIDNLWDHDPDPRATLDVQAQIDAAIERGDVDCATDANGRPVGNYFCCPWAPVYVARRAVVIAGRRLRSLQQFTFDVSAEEMPEGGPFKRELLLGTFHPTAEVDYCDPTAGGHAD